MAKGSKEKYSPKQIRKAKYIEKSYQEKRAPPKEATRRAWATVNKIYGNGSGGSGSGQVLKRSRKGSGKKTINCGSDSDND